MFSIKLLLNKFLLLTFLLIGHLSYGQDTIAIHSQNFGKLHETSLIEGHWYFHAGSLSKSDRQGRSTAGWEELHSTTFEQQNTPKGWRGTGWFAIWIKIDSGLIDKKLSLRINHDGASEIFIDGNPVGGYGKVGNSAIEMQAIRAPRELIPLWFSDDRPHLLTIHYSNFFGVYPNFLGFETWIGDFKTKSDRITGSKQLFGFVPIFAAAEVILGLLHLLLFLFYPKQKLNLYVAVFVLLVGMNGIGVYFFYLTRFPSIQFLAEVLTNVCRILMMFSGVLLIYTLDYGRVPRWRLIALSTVSALCLLNSLSKFLLQRLPPDESYFPFVFFVFTVDSLYSAYHLVKKKQQSVWLILTGVISVSLVYFFALADVFHLWPYEFNTMRVFVMSAGNLILPFCLSLYLALDYARTNQTLVTKLIDVERLSAMALSQEAEKNKSMAAEASRLEELVQQRTAEIQEKAEKLKEMDVIKSRFFTNITHEFKTPLTLIINPVKDLLNEPLKPHQLYDLNLVLNNATRLLELINQLLDLSKLENGSMEITTEPLDLIALITVHIRSYDAVIIQKGISLNLLSEQEQLWILADKDMLDKIMLNLLSNAIKFTDNGRVEIAIEAIGAVINLSIRDTGRGIPATKLPYIFSRFYQADPSDTRLAGGTGIGLAIVKELVDLLDGNISVRSEEGFFTEFNLQLPYLPAMAKTMPMAATHPANANAAINQNEYLLPVADEDSALVLLIEDHGELRNFMQRTLSTIYRVISAEDGNKGLALGLEHIPNLIITDLMMPGLDGYAVSSRLKQDQRTSHIPIIILTAKADIDSRIRGIETGADVYLGKPFDKRELFALIENQLNLRRQLQERYSENEIWFKDALSLPSIEQAFLGRVHVAVETHMNEAGYSADQLAQDLGLSRMQLHRKVKALTGQAPGELIRVIRLRYAHDLLQKQIGTVAEVAYKIGFSSPASFSASFSRHFGYPPSKVPIV